jgi:hypothetical protein
MAIPAFDMEPYSAPPPPTEAGAAATAPPKTEAKTAKPPPASLISIRVKAKPTAATKTGDLTRFFDLARQEPAPSIAAPPPEPPAAPISPESPPFELTAEPAPVEAVPPVGATVVSEVAYELPEPSLETMLVPPPAAAAAPDSEPACAAVDIDAEPMLPSAPPMEAIPEAPPSAATVSPVEPTPSAEPLAVEIAPVEPPAHRQVMAPASADLADYWRSLRAGDDHPAAQAVDRDLVTERWPGSLLIGYTPATEDPRGEPRPAQVTRLGTACAETQDAVDAGSYATEWMLEVARAALLNDEPVEELQRLPTRNGAAGFRMLALPLGPAQGLANAVLCALTPSSAAPRFGKRRAWL